MGTRGKPGSGRTAASAGRPAAGPGIVAMRAAAVALALAAVYSGVLWYQLNVVLGDGGRLEDDANASVAALSSDISAFRGDPESASKLLPKLEKGRKSIADIRAKAAVVGGVVWPPFGSAGDEYRESLGAYAGDVDRYYLALSKIGGFVVDRGDVVTQLSAGLQVLDGLSKPGTNNSDVRRIIEKARSAVDKSADQLRSLSATGAGEISVYSNEALLARMTGLSGLLANIVDGLEKRDTQLVQAGTQGFSKLMKADWQVLFYSADEPGLTKFAETLKTLSADRQSISAARRGIAEKRTALGTAAIGLAVIAMFAAAVAWLR